jgi:hypothetical protein
MSGRRIVMALLLDAAAHALITRIKRRAEAASR